MTEIFLSSGPPSPGCLWTTRPCGRRRFLRRSATCCCTRRAFRKRFQRRGTSRSSPSLLPRPQKVQIIFKLFWVSQYFTKKGTTNVKAVMVLQKNLGNYSYPTFTTKHETFVEKPSFRKGLRNKKNVSVIKQYQPTSNLISR